MPVNTYPTRGNLRGFSLIEMMIAVAAGLIVVGAVLSFTVASIRTNVETVTVTRLTQDLRLMMNLFSRELRRAGYDRGAETSIASSTPGIRYTTLVPDGIGAGGVPAAETDDCILFSYNRQANATTGALAGEAKGFRRIVRGGVGVVQAYTQDVAAAAATAPDCDTDTNWTDLTTPGQVDVTSLSFTVTAPAVAGLPAGITANVRTVDVLIAARLVNDTDIARQLQTTVRVRADDIVFPP